MLIIQTPNTDFSQALRILHQEIFKDQNNHEKTYAT